VEGGKGGREGREGRKGKKGEGREGRREGGGRKEGKREGGRRERSVILIILTNLFTTSLSLCPPNVQPQSSHIAHFSLIFS